MVASIQPAISPVPSSLVTFHNTKLPQYGFDVKKAEALLDDKDAEAL